jgi:hypothetical protein
LYDGHTYGSFDNYGIAVGPPFFDWFFSFHHCVEKRCNIMDIIVIILLMDIHEEYWKWAVVPAFGTVDTLG